MTLPPLYKYLNVQGAKLTLGNRTFRHAKPSDFNDIEDMTVQSIFPEEMPSRIAISAIDCDLPVVSCSNQTEARAIAFTTTASGVLPFSPKTSLPDPLPGR